MKGGCYMIRETISGHVTEYSKFWVPQGTKPRASRRGKCSARKQDANDRDAAKRLARIINCNFDKGDAYLTLTYATDTERAEGERKAKNFLRRLRRRADKLGLPFRWILVTSQKDGEGEAVRLHHHLILSAGLVQFDGKTWKIGNDSAEKAWGLGAVDVRTMRGQQDYTQMAVYLVRQARREPDEKKWTCSRNMKKPIVRERIVVTPGPMKAPKGAIVLHVGEYDSQIGSHYLRFIRRRKGEEITKRGEERGKETEP